MGQDKNIINEKNNISVSQRWGTARLRLLFLGPLAVVIGIVIFVLSALLYEYTSREVQDGVIRIRASVQDFYEESIRYDAKALQAVMNTLRQDDKLVNALARSDRDELLQRATPLFKDIKRDFSISHLYFTGVDKVNILRVHTPSRYGDVIKRITMDKAEKSGAVAYGVELGPLGTFTLRVVAPWYDNRTHKLIGYVELGMEVDHVVKKLQQFFGVQTLTLINKKFLNREKWEDGMRTLGRTPNWNRFEDKVTSEHSINSFPTHLAEELIHNKYTTDGIIINLMHDNLSYRITTLPLQDAGGRIVAEMILITDVSAEEETARQTLNIGIIVAFIGGVILFAFFYLLVGRIGNRIELNENELRKIATHDGLTGLYNHKFFYTMLENELIRSKRYKHSTALLLLDIDHFKNVNDTYGHRSGDMILRGLSERLKNRVRITDSVSRYGGEEITIILPETDIMTAKQIAEDLRTLIKNEAFKIEDEQHINITVSIGVSVSPENAKEASSLVSCADKALYEAKESGRNKVCVYEMK